jgi:hypothetical protein
MKATFQVFKNCGYTIGKDNSEANPKPTKEQPLPLLPTQFHGTKKKKTEDKPDYNQSGKPRPLLPNLKY